MHTVLAVVVAKHKYKSLSLMKTSRSSYFSNHKIQLLSVAHVTATDVSHFDGIALSDDRRHRSSQSEKWFENHSFLCVFSTTMRSNSFQETVLIIYGNASPHKHSWKWKNTRKKKKENCLFFLFLLFKWVQHSVDQMHPIALKQENEIHCIVTIQLHRQREVRSRFEMTSN